MRGIVESPLAGDTVNNLRFALWCCRYLWTDRDTEAIASHMLCPWFMDDSIPAERKAGINWPWCWDRDTKHWFFDDLGWSNGMKAARDRCVDDGIPWVVTSLAGTVAGDAFYAGDWPPHTQGFQIATASEQEEHMRGVRDGSSRS